MPLCRRGENPMASYTYGYTVGPRAAGYHLSHMQRNYANCYAAARVCVRWFKND